MNDVTLSFANPFNGIESIPPLTPLDGSQESSNPFNGIEREVDPCTERGNPLRNPFNGIESLSAYAAAISSTSTKNPFNGIEERQKTYRANKMKI